MRENRNIKLLNTIDEVCYLAENNILHHSVRSIH